IDTPDAMAKSAAMRAEQGYTTVVVKVGRDPDNDVARVRCVREAVGNTVRIRLDANEGYRPDEAIRILRQVERYEPEFIEEPVRHWDLDGMAAVARAVAMPVSSDESNSTPQTVMQIIDKRAASVLNLKISKNGGLFRCKQIAAIAEPAGVEALRALDARGRQNDGIRGMRASIAVEDRRHLDAVPRLRRREGRKGL